MEIRHRFGKPPPEAEGESPKELEAWMDLTGFRFAVNDPQDVEQED